MSSITVCPYCRNKCASCNTSTNSSHPVWACYDCKHKNEGKCCVCGGPKKGPGSVGAVGAGKVCNKCYKVNTCALCGKHL